MAGWLVSQTAPQHLIKRSLMDGSQRNLTTHCHVSCAFFVAGSVALNEQEGQGFGTLTALAFAFHHIYQFMPLLSVGGFWGLVMGKHQL